MSYRQHCRRDRFGKFFSVVGLTHVEDGITHTSLLNSSCAYAAEGGMSYDLL